MGFQMCVIGVIYKTPFRRAGHIWHNILNLYKDLKRVTLRHCLASKTKSFISLLVCLFNLYSKTALHLLPSLTPRPVTHSCLNCQVVPNVQFGGYLVHLHKGQRKWQWWSSTCLQWQKINLVLWPWFLHCDHSKSMYVCQACLVVLWSFLSWSALFLGTSLNIPHIFCKN